MARKLESENGRTRDESEDTRRERRETDAEDDGGDDSA